MLWGSSRPRLFTDSQGPESIGIAKRPFLKFLPKPKPVALDSSVSQGAELAGSVIVFFFIGFGLDTWMGTTPWFMIASSVFGLIGQFIKMYFSYTSAMSHHEQERIEKTRGIASE